jgi:flavin reductase (DIM6/NTAB) family NADH-FMN oxidoreductase RutF
MTTATSAVPSFERSAIISSDVSTSMASPNPSWKIGEKQPSPFRDQPFITISPDDVPSSYSLMISAITPRPVAFVSSQSEAGVNNLSPFSYFSAVSHDPPLISIGVCNNRDGSKKDTLVNIEETEEFTVNIISEWMVEAANHTCGAFKPDVDEFEMSGLTPLKSDLVKPFRVEESAFHMECKFHSKTEVFNDKGVHTTTIVLGRVIKFHVAEPILVDKSKWYNGMPVVDTLKMKVFLVRT